MESHPSPALLAAAAAIGAARPDWRVVVHATIDSTSDEAHRLGPLAGTTLPLVVLADHQTAGRGQQGRAWDGARAQSFLGTAAFPMAGPPPALPSFQAACAVAEALELLTCAAIEWKWPNDLLLNGGKVCGVLTERRGGWLLAGVGVNLLQGAGELPPRDPGVPRATSLALELGGAAPARDRAIAAIAGSLIARLESPLPADVLLGAVLKRWQGEGRTVRVLGTAGPLEGVMDGIDAHGRLVVRTPSGVVAVSSPQSLTPE